MVWGPGWELSQLTQGAGEAFMGTFPSPAFLAIAPVVYTALIWLYEKNKTNCFSKGIVFLKSWDDKKRLLETIFWEKNINLANLLSQSISLHCLETENCC